MAGIQFSSYSWTSTYHYQQLSTRCQVQGLCPISLSGLSAWHLVPRLCPVSIGGPLSLCSATSRQPHVVDSTPSLFAASALSLSLGCLLGHTFIDSSPSFGMTLHSVSCVRSCYIPVSCCLLGLMVLDCPFSIEELSPQPQGHALLRLSTAMSTRIQLHSFCSISVSELSTWPVVPGSHPV